MDFLTDPVLLARIQFALTAMYHFIFVPLSIGLGLIVAIFETKYYRSSKPEDAAASRFWVKVFTATFALGVATGITMEFSFGTNWADYARFVGDIFGAPLAAEALLAFFLESVFLGVLLFGRKKVGRKFYLASAWLVWFGSCLSALWIIIANSWMQTPDGAALSADGTQAILTNFIQAAFNASTMPRYLHTVDGLLIMGSFMALAIGAWYLKKGRHTEFAMKTVRVASGIALATTCLMVVFAHQSAVVVAEEQPTKFAMMEGAYHSEAMPLYALGWVDEENQEVITPFAIEGGTSFLASGDFNKEYPGLNELAASGVYGDAFTEETIDELPVNTVFQSYHLMVVMFGLITLTTILAFIFSYRKDKIKSMRWLQNLAIISPLFPFLAIQSGWITAEIGRQPWSVYPATSSPEGVSLLTENANSLAVSSPELVITLVLFCLIYLFLIIGWARIVIHLIKKGPKEDETDSILTNFGSNKPATAGAGTGSATTSTTAAKTESESTANDASTQGKDGE